MESVIERMQAELLPSSRVRLVLPEVGFDLLITFLGEALWVLRDDRDEFSAQVGILPEEAESLKDELLLIRYGTLGVPRPRLHSGELWGPTDARRTGAAWDGLPKMDAERLPDERVALKLGRGEVSIFANSVDATVSKLAPKRSEWEEKDFRSLLGLSTEEVEAFRDELRRLGREVRDDAPSDPSGG